MNIQKKVLKKSSQEVMHIKVAHNMVEVESLISQAVLKTFGLWNIGMLAISMRKGNEQRLINYIHYKGNIELLKAIRHHNYATHNISVRLYLMSFIPVQLRNTSMYIKLADRLTQQAA